MTSRSSYAALSFTLSFILWHCVLISAQDTTAPLPTSTPVPHGNQQVTVGWVGNPKRRGTLTILIECLTTIFACTWTVLHLNIPTTTDSTKTRVLRKVKWMAITILFPEFIFVKAVCELRFALYTLNKMYESVQQSPQRFATDAKVDVNGSSYWASRKWTVEFEPLKIWLYHLLLRPAAPVGLKADSTSPEGLVEVPTSNSKNVKVQKWTLIHAYYVNMGGIVAQKKKRLRGEGSNGKTVLTDSYSVVRGDLLADSELKAWRLGHPLQELRLSVDEIKDKSKADWIVKTIALIQIGRLILDLITRSIGGQPVTQLEIATASFAVFAIVTHLINWWKPKDIMQPTALHSVVDESRDGDLFGRTVESCFAPRLWSPAPRPHHNGDTIPEVSRIADDELWIDEKNLSATWSLMLGSCLVFGGIHCIAWSFWFPTRVEQLAWQAAALTSMILPVIGWAGLFALYLHRSRKHKKSLAEAVEETVNPFGADLLGADDDWWNAFTSAVKSKEWDEWIEEHPITNKKDIKRLRWDLDTMARLRTLLRGLWRSKRNGIRGEEEEIIKNIWDIERNLSAARSKTCDLRDQYETWFKDQDAFLYGTLPTKEDPQDPTRMVEDPVKSAEYKAWLQERDEQLKIPLWKDWIFENHDAEKRRRLQRSTKVYYLRYGEPAPDPGLFRWIFFRCEAINKRRQTQYLNMWRDFDNERQRHSRFLNMVVAILYTVARLMLLAIMFSSLRAAPDGVYDTPDWTRFMPSFS